MDASDSEQLQFQRTPFSSTMVLSPDENFEEFTLIWLDSDVNKTPDCIDTKVKLKELIHFMVTFDDDDTCLKYIRSIHTEKILFIVSGKLGKVVLPDIQNLPQILFIYIFCENKVEHEQWSRNYQNKLQGVFVNKDDLLSKLTADLKTISMNLVPFSVFDLTTSESTIQDLNDDKVTFLWFQLLIEALLQIKHNNINAKNEMIRECRLYYRNNKTEKDRIGEFNSIYTSDSAIRWYTRDCFLYRLINKALRTQNIDIIFKFRFFIKDLYNQLKNEHTLQFGDVTKPSFSVYRGQLMPLSELDKLKNSVGGYCSINTFLSTTTSSTVAVSFTGSGGGRPTYESVVFEIKIDVSITTNDDNLKPFASIEKLSYMSDENEILFSIGTVFKIENVEQLTDDIWYITLTLSEQIDENIKKIIDFHKEKLYENNEGAKLSGLAMLLVEMGDYNKAERYYQILLHELLADNDVSNADRQTDIVCIHMYIGQIYYEKGDYDKAMKKYELALSIVSPHSVALLAGIYNNMGTVYKRQDDDDMALKMYEKSLELYSDLPETVALAVVYNNIGAMHQKKQAYEIALQYYNKSFTIRKQLCPPNHPDLTTVCNNIGTLCHTIGEYEMALKYFKAVLNLGLSTLPALHISIGYAYSNIATVYDEKNQYSEALVYYYKARDIYLANNMSNHQDLSTIYTNIAINEKCTDNFSDAMIHYQLALEVELNCSIPNSLRISKLYQVMGQLYEKLSNSHEAVTHYEKSLVYHRHSSVANSDHEWFIHMYNIIGNSYKLQEEYGKALENYTKAKELMIKADVLNNIDLAAICINIGHTSLENDGNIENALKIYADAVDYLNCVKPLTEEHLPIAVTIYYNIAKLHFEKKNIEIALINFEKVLELKLSYMTANDSSLGTTFDNIGMCYTQSGDLSQAIINFDRAVQIHSSNGESDQLNLAICYNNMAIVYTNHRKYVEAIIVLNRSIEIKRATYNNNLISSEDLASAYIFLGIIYEKNKNYLQAYLNYTYALEKIQLSDNYCMAAEIHKSIGRINLQSKRYNEAIEYYKKALERSAVLDELTISLIYNEIGLAYCRMYNMQMALEHFNISLNIQLTKLPAHNLSITHTYNLLGEAYYEMNDFTQAINYHETAIKVILSVCNCDDSPCAELLTAYSNLACIYCQQRSYSESLLYFALTLEAQFKRRELNGDVDEINYEISKTFTSIASVYYVQNNCNKALLYYENALYSGLIELFKSGDKAYFLLGKLSRILENIAFMWYKKDDRVQALLYLRAAVQILLTSPCAEDQNFVMELNNKIQIINKQLWILDQ